MEDLFAALIFLAVYQLDTTNPYSIARMTSSWICTVNVVFDAMSFRESDCIVMGAKPYPPAVRQKPHSIEAEERWYLTHDHLRENLMDTLQALEIELDLRCLHGPHRATAFAVTPNAVNDLYQKGFLKHLTISNHMACKVVKICEIAQATRVKLSCTTDS